MVQKIGNTGTGAIAGGRRPERSAKSPEQALSALMRLCARAERSSGDALRLMRRWGLSDADARRVLARLVAESFVDDARYAAAFVRDKMRLSGWGVYKIRATLASKGIDSGTIDAALSEAMSGADMHERLSALLSRRMRSVKASSPYDLRAKLMRYALSQGYDYATARDCVEKLVKVADTDFF